MDEKQVLLVKHSWSYVASQLDDFCVAFSKKMGQLTPELKPLVKQLADDKKLPGIMTTINSIVVALPDFRKAEKDILTLLAEYSDKGITKDNYDVGLIGFLMALERKMGKSWNTEIRDAWIFVFASIHIHFMQQLKVPSTLLVKKVKEAQTTLS